MSNKKVCKEFLVHRKIMLNANVSRHYMDKSNRAKALRELSYMECHNDKEFFNHFDIMVYVYPPTRRRLDPANLYPTVKHLIDGLTDAGWWEDDDWTRLRTLSFRYGGLSGEKNIFKIKMEIEEVEEDE